MVRPRARISYRSRQSGCLSPYGLHRRKTSCWRTSSPSWETFNSKSGIPDDDPWSGADQGSLDRRDATACVVDDLAHQAKRIEERVDLVGSSGELGNGLIGGSLKEAPAKLRQARIDRRGTGVDACDEELA